jgi:hypothetical protein
MATVAAEGMPRLKAIEPDDGRSSIDQLQRGEAAHCPMPMIATL